MWIEQCVFAACSVIASEERLPLAPTSAAYDGVPFCFDHKIGSVGYKLIVYPENCSERSFDLGW
jgi:hypothetical protein